MEMFVAMFVDLCWRAAASDGSQDECRDITGGRVWWQVSLTGAALGEINANGLEMKRDWSPSVAVSALIGASLSAALAGAASSTTFGSGKQAASWN